MPKWSECSSLVIKGSGSKLGLCMWHFLKLSLSVPNFRHSWGIKGKGGKEVRRGAPPQVRRCQEQVGCLTATSPTAIRVIWENLRLIPFNNY